MDLKIDPHGHVPIYLQIVRGVRSAIASGALRPGDALPSLRALGVRLIVNPNTVQRAYDELEREGLIAPRRGVGMFVAEGGADSARPAAEGAVAEAFRLGIEAGRAARLEPARLRELFEAALDSAANGKPRGPGGRR
jgi:GntR family transcriptional regulator